MWVFGISVSARFQAAKQFLSYQEVSWEYDFISRQPPRTFFVLRSSLPAIVQRRPAMAVGMLEERAPEMAFHLRAGTYNQVLVFQRLALDPQTREYVAIDETALGPEFVLETIEERQHKPLYRERISRLIDVDLARVQPRPEGWKPKFPPFNLVPELDETPAGSYTRQFLRMLP
jgi:hypothetical protein